MAPCGGCHHGDRDKRGVTGFQKWELQTLASELSVTHASTYKHTQLLYLCHLNDSFQHCRLRKYFKYTLSLFTIPFRLINIIFQQPLFSLRLWLSDRSIQICVCQTYTSDFQNCQSQAAVVGCALLHTKCRAGLAHQSIWLEHGCAMKCWKHSGHKLVRFICMLLHLPEIEWNWSPDLFTILFLCFLWSCRISISNCLSTEGWKGVYHAESMEQCVGHEECHTGCAWLSYKH